MTGRKRRDKLGEVQALVEMLHLFYTGCGEAGLTQEQGYELTRMWLESELKVSDDAQASERGDK